MIRKAANGRDFADSDASGTAEVRVKMLRAGFRYW